VVRPNLRRKEVATLGGISAGYDRDLAGLQLGWRRLLLI
jgi:hypothetical protein